MTKYSILCSVLTSLVFVHESSASNGVRQLLKGGTVMDDSSYYNILDYINEGDEFNYVPSQVRGNTWTRAVNRDFDRQIAVFTDRQCVARDGFTNYVSIDVTNDSMYESILSHYRDTENQKEETVEEFVCGEEAKAFGPFDVEWNTYDKTHDSMYVHCDGFISAGMPLFGFPGTPNSIASMYGKHNLATTVKVTLTTSSISVTWTLKNEQNEEFTHTLWMTSHGQIAVSYSDIDMLNGFETEPVYGVKGKISEEFTEVINNVVLGKEFYLANPTLIYDTKDSDDETETYFACDVFEMWYPTKASADFFILQSDGQIVKKNKNLEIAIISPKLKTPIMPNEAVLTTEVNVPVVGTTNLTNIGGGVLSAGLVSTGGNPIDYEFRRLIDIGNNTNYELEITFTPREAGTFETIFYVSAKDDFGNPPPTYDGRRINVKIIALPVTTTTTTTVTSTIPIKTTTKGPIDTTPESGISTPSTVPETTPESGISTPSPSPTRTVAPVTTTTTNVTTTIPSTTTTTSSTPKTTTPQVGIPTLPSKTTTPEMGISTPQTKPPQSSITETTLATESTEQSSTESTLPSTHDTDSTTTTITVTQNEQTSNLPLILGASAGALAGLGLLVGAGFLIAGSVSKKGKTIPDDLEVVQDDMSEPEMAPPLEESMFDEFPESGSEGDNLDQLADAAGIENSNSFWNNSNQDSFAEV